MEETFRFHNQDRDLSDYGIIEDDIRELGKTVDTIGEVVELVGEKLFNEVRTLHDLSTYQVIMLWPVTDGLRIGRVQQFTDARQGYRLDWNAWYRQINPEDQRRLPLREFNRARLYFDIRLVPIAAADLHPLCRELARDDVDLAKSYLDRFSKTHFFSLVTGQWNPDTYAPMRERESQRSKDAKAWYETATTNPTGLGRRIAKVLRELNLDAKHEQSVESPHGRVRADVLVKRDSLQPNLIVELKAFSTENTMPSTICSAVQTTLRRHSQFAGFLQQQ